MTDIRAALEALMPPDEFIDSTGEYEMLEVHFRFEGYRWREFRAALAAVPVPEPERCAATIDIGPHRGWPCRRDRVHDIHDDLSTMMGAHPFQPAPTAEALRDALVAKKHWDYHSVLRGCVEPCQFKADLDAIIAAARADVVPDSVSLTEAYERGRAERCEACAGNFVDGYCPEHEPSREASR